LKQSDRSKRELFPVTPSSLQIQNNEASVAAFLDYLEAFYETLENALEGLERLEQSYEKMSIMERAGRSKPTEGVPIRIQYEGTYGWGVEYFFNAMGHLMELLYVTMRKGSQLKHEARFLTEYQCLYLFIGIAIQAGFAVTLLVNFQDISSYCRDNKDFTAFDSFTRLIDFTRPLRGEDWDTFRSKAIKGVPYLEQEVYNRSQRNILAIFNWGRPLFYYHPMLFGSGEANKVVSEIITEEVIRFRRFLEAFHGTLQFLADAKPLAQSEVKPPVFDWDKRNEALDIFKDTIHLLRTVANKQEIIPQHDATIIVKRKVTSPAKVTLQVRKEEHTGDLHSYHLTLTDSQHLSEPVPFLLQVSESGEAELFEDDSDG